LQARCARAGIRFTSHVADAPLDAPLQALFAVPGQAREHRLLPSALLALAALLLPLLVHLVRQTERRIYSPRCWQWHARNHGGVRASTMVVVAGTLLLLALLALWLRSRCCSIVAHARGWSCIRHRPGAAAGGIVRRTAPLFGARLPAAGTTVASDQHPIGSLLRN
jgi:hypothetical protein